MCAAAILTVHHRSVCRFAALILVIFAGHWSNAQQTMDYEHDLKPILARKCYSCHGALKQEASLRLDTAQRIQSGGDSGPAIESNEVDDNLLWQRVQTEDEDSRMPPEGEPLSDAELAILRQWIEQGAPAPDNEAPQADPRQHWAFQPVSEVQPPSGQGHPIDRFIREKLKQAQLQPANRADTRTLVRRLFFDLHGLPPTAPELRHWTSVIEQSSAIDSLIDHLLASPRYGERFAQSWLDLVRYADTHGFEVNTPRPHAWPYRDYVIRSFNDDTPYDQFIRQQLAGDQLNQDAATGFLVAAAVLLPGQIGKDDASKRLARQDSLDEMVVGTSATFLGLTVGCARCHDHKFDPISQRDYYAMQAFFAGVDYGDRAIKDADFQAKRAQADELGQRINDLEAQLLALKPKPLTGRSLVIDDEDLDRVTILKEKNGHGTNPAGTKRGYKADPGNSDRMPNLSNGRYTWWDNHPGEDVFTWNPKTAGRFRIWISWGAHGSGVHTRDAHYVLDRDGDLATKDDQQNIAQADQLYYAGQQDGDSEKTPRWSGLQDAGVHELTEKSKLILRGGETGSGITADVMVLQEEDPTAPSTPSLPRLRVPVQFDINRETFAAIDAKFVRFTSQQTTNHDRYEPCIDELEVFSSDSETKNVALASGGAIATSSGNYSNTGRHQLKHINDGRYGNDDSWISHQKGQGWVQIELPEITSINQIVWGRDRNGKYQDRLPVRYTIEVSRDGKQWHPVASSQQRLAFGTPHQRSTTLARNASPTRRASLLETIKTMDQLQGQVATLRKPKLVYAGKFRQPDETHLLNRGDPEQPLDLLSPVVPSILGDTAFASETTDAQRRLGLADWIASPDHPLTARVMANRIWQFHFGRGLVETPSDFGMNGAQPTHPELLDWLANQLITSGWSIKAMHRMLLTSQTYQQSSHIDPDNQAIDADCKLLWRFPSRRLEAEAIRDSMLATSGELNLQMGGPGFDFFKSRGGLSGFPPVESFGANELRRMIYAHKIRMESVPIFGAFDCPDAGQPMPKRSSSTTAIQALNLFNSSFVFERARAVAQRVKAKQADPSQHVIETFRLMLGRDPSKMERGAAQRLVDQSNLSNLARVLLNSNEFLFLP